MTDSLADATHNNYNDNLFTYRLEGTNNGYFTTANKQQTLSFNQVVSIATDNALTYGGGGSGSTDMDALLVPLTAPQGVTYSSSVAFKILLLIEALPVHICCPFGASTDRACSGCAGWANDNSGFSGSAGGFHVTAGANYGAHSIFKCIFNIDMISTYADAT